MSFFDQVPEAPPDVIFGVNVAFKNDPAPDKLNIVVGAYRTEEGKPLVLNCVRKAEERILHSSDKEYLPIDGHPEFNRLAAGLLFGRDYGQLAPRALSGTGALRLGAEFIRRFLPGATVYLSEPTWRRGRQSNCAANHKNIFTQAGVPWKAYRYYNNNSLDFDGLMQDVEAAPAGSVFLLHACAHNPTGLDPTPQQWTALSDALRRKGHLPFLDCAYQGFASGDLDADAAALRLLAGAGGDVLVAQSFAKNMGLYGERVGAIHVLCSNPDGAKIKSVARAAYSNPPMHGALIVAGVLGDPSLRAEWEVELKAMSGRIQEMRQLLHDELARRGIQWPHIMKQIGMFAYSGMTAKHVEVLVKKHHIYLTSDGRISLPGLSRTTVPKLAAAIEDALHSANL